MLKALSTILSSCALSVLISNSLMTEKAQASFACGQHLSTYRVQSLGGANGQGVRCVKFHFGNIIWYGEGYWGEANYRHFGLIPAPGVLGGGITDISGNGESFNSFTSSSALQVSRGESINGIPISIRLTGAWNEEWIYESDGVVQEYTSQLGPVRVCDETSNQLEYRVRDESGLNSGEGIRCYVGAIWYGEGNWNGETYAHIGFRQRFNRPSAIAFDICEPSKFSFCSRANSLSFDATSLSNVIRVSGDWNEVWRRNPN